MGEQKRKHVAEIVAKAILCGAVIERHNTFQHGSYKTSAQTRFGAELPEDLRIIDPVDSVRIYRVFGDTEYQCAVKYLTLLGVPYETLTYGSPRINPSPTARLRRGKR